MSKKILPLRLLQNISRQPVRIRSAQVIFHALARRILKRKLRKLGTLKELFLEKQGLEIGGPSAIFTDKGYCPVYSLARQIDGVNFGAFTVWEGALKEGETYEYLPKRFGTQWISEASNLCGIEDNSYDFILSSNCLEHVANPIKAIESWLRVLKIGGVLLLILPRRESNFDHRRPITSIRHLRDDFDNEIGEDDLTHLDEIIKLHDLRLDKWAGPFEDFLDRSKKNYLNRCFHHHVFDLALSVELFKDFPVEVVLQSSSLINHHVLVRKLENT